MKQGVVLLVQTGTETGLGEETPWGVTFRGSHSVFHSCCLESPVAVQQRVAVLVSW